MKKTLDEIEARLLMNLVSGEEDAHLLIRAVRQLGQTAKGEGFPDYWTGSEWREVDDDVVALLEEGRSAE